MHACTQHDTVIPMHYMHGMPGCRFVAGIPTYACTHVQALIRRPWRLSSSACVCVHRGDRERVRERRHAGGTPGAERQGPPLPVGPRCGWSHFQARMARMRVGGSGHVRPDWPGQGEPPLSPRTAVCQQAHHARTMDCRSSSASLRKLRPVGG